MNMVSISLYMIGLALLGIALEYGYSLWDRRHPVRAEAQESSPSVKALVETNRAVLAALIALASKQERVGMVTAERLARAPFMQQVQPEPAQEAPPPERTPDAAGSFRAGLS